MQIITGIICIYKFIMSKFRKMLNLTSNYYLKQLVKKNKLNFKNMFFLKIPQIQIKRILLEQIKVVIMGYKYNANLIRELHGSELNTNITKYCKGLIYHLFIKEKNCYEAMTKVQKLFSNKKYSELYTDLVIKIKALALKGGFVVTF